MLKFTLKLLACVAGAIFALFAVVALIFLVVNWNDQPPSDLSNSFNVSYKNRIKVFDNENSFVYLMGFSVAEYQEPAVIGAKRIEFINKILSGQAGDLEGNPLMIDKDFKIGRSQTTQVFIDSCGRVVTQKCFDALLHGDESIPLWMESEKILYRRYVELLNYPHYQNTLKIDEHAPLPNFGAVMNTQKLFLAHMYWLAKKGESQQVKILLEKDINYWREVLSSSDSLVAKMVAVAALKCNFIISNFIFRELAQRQNPYFYLVPDAWQKPLSPSELSISNCLISEWGWMNKLISNLSKGIKYEPKKGYIKGYSQMSEFLMSFALQPQDFSNKNASQLKTMIDLSDVSLNQYPETIIKSKKLAEAPKKPDFHFYNLTGDILIHIALPPFLDYATRVADLEGVRQAAILTSEIRNQSLSAEAIPDYITRSTYQNPYTLKPFEWDSESKAVKFTGLEEGERGTYLFAY